MLKQNFQKNTVDTGKTTFFVIDPFCTPHSICLNIGQWLLRGRFCKDMLPFQLKYFQLQRCSLVL